MRKLLLVGAAALALGGSAAAVASQTPRNETFRMLELFGDVLGIVEQAYVVPVDNKKLIEAALQGMMTALDPHSNYMPAKAFGDLRERTSGEYSGVGLTITSEGGLVKVISPMDDSPAGRAGVQAGDVISAVNGQNAAGLSVSEVSDKLRGATGKYLLRRAFAPLLPPRIADQPKRGFGLPLAAWFRGPLRAFARDLLAGGRLVKDIARPEAVEALLVAHEAGRADHGKRLFTLVMLELWLRRYL